MKKKISLMIALLTVLALALVLGGCNGTETYTIQYTDDAGVHSLTVEAGGLYSLESLPERFGYDFLGLFDAKTGGKQYVDENGSALSAFEDEKNLVLFPRFKAKEYTLFLDYRGAEAIGGRSIKVSYGSEISGLPANPTIANMTFEGWFTEAEGKGIKVADKQGAMPETGKVVETVFDLTDENGNIYIYAYFTINQYTVTLYSEDGKAPETFTVDHGTDIKTIVPTARVNGNAVLVWSTVRNDTNKESVFTGKITEDMVLYAAEYAPVIDFDANGGDAPVPLVALAGSAVELPTPTRENYEFIEWQDENGNTYTSTVMPSESITVKAVWQAKLVFDENGGADVLDISKPRGETVELPTPTREGYIFAGWYTSDKEKYTSNVMPAEGIALKAGWYEEKTLTLHKVKGDSKIGGFHSIYITMEDRLTFNLTKYLPEDFSGTVKIDAHLKIKHDNASITKPKTMTLKFYRSNTVSDTELLYSTSFVLTSEKYAQYDYSFTADLEGNVIYGAVVMSSSSGSAYISDYYYDLTYPDTANLIL